MIYEAPHPLSKREGAVHIDAAEPPRNVKDVLMIVGDEIKSAEQPLDAHPANGEHDRDEVEPCALVGKRPAEEEKAKEDRAEQDGNACPTPLAR